METTCCAQTAHAVADILNSPLASSADRHFVKSALTGRAACGTCPRDYLTAEPRVPAKARLRGCARGCPQGFPRRGCPPLSARRLSDSLSAWQHNSAAQSSAAQLDHSARQRNSTAQLDHAARQRSSTTQLDRTARPRSLPRKALPTSGLVASERSRARQRVHNREHRVCERGRPAALFATDSSRSRAFSVRAVPG